MKKYPWNSIFTDISPYYSWNQKTLEDNPSSSIFPCSCIFVVTLNIFFSKLQQCGDAIKNWVPVKNWISLKKRVCTRVEKISLHWLQKGPGTNQPWLTRAYLLVKFWIYTFFFQKKKVFCAKKSLYGENTLILIRSSDIFFIFILDHPDFFWILEMKTSFSTKIPFFGLWAPFIENEGWLLVEWMEKGWKCEISKGGTPGCMEYLQFHYVIFVSGEI